MKLRPTCRHVCGESDAPGGAAEQGCKVIISVWAALPTSQGHEPLCHCIGSESLSSCSRRPEACESRRGVSPPEATRPDPAVVYRMPSKSIYEPVIKTSDKPAARTTHEQGGASRRRGGLRPAPHLPPSRAAPRPTGAPTQM